LQSPIVTEEEVMIVLEPLKKFCDISCITIAGHLHTGINLRRREKNDTIKQNDGNPCFLHFGRGSCFTIFGSAAFALIFFGKL
jgi:hypothetical protein